MFVGVGNVGDAVREQMCADRGCFYDSFTNQCDCTPREDTLRRAPEMPGGPKPTSPSTSSSTVASMGLSSVLLLGAVVVVGGSFLLGRMG